MRDDTMRGLIISYLIVLVVVSGCLHAHETTSSTQSDISLPNPAAAYCVKRGYRYSNEYCIFSDGSKCKAWDFLNGRCGNQYSLCEMKYNGRLIPSNKSCSISKNCGIYVLPSGRKCFEWDLFTGKCGMGNNTAETSNEIIRSVKVSILYQSIVDDFTVKQGHR